jgi:hypothetical protein
VVDALIGNGLVALLAAAAMLVQIGYAAIRGRPRLGAFAANGLAGIMLALALYTALTDGSQVAILVLLAVSLLANIAYLRLDR